MASRLVAVPCSQLATRQQDSLQVGDVVLLTRRKNPGQVEVGSLSQFVYRGLIYPRWLFGISEPSTVLFCLEICQISRRWEEF